jgi:hypothetical protein
LTALYGEAALGVWHGVTEERLREVEAWYNAEHHRDRVAIDGFLRARRYRNRGAGQHFFSRYDARDIGVLGCAAYLHSLSNPSPRSKEIFPHYRDTVRGAFHVAARAGLPDGGELLSLRFHDREADAEALEARLRALVPSLVADTEGPGVEGVVRAELWRIDVPTTTIRTEEKALRSAPDVYPTLALLIDLTSEDRAVDCLNDPLLAEVIGEARVDHLRLVYSLSET